MLQAAEEKLVSLFLVCGNSVYLVIVKEKEKNIKFNEIL